MKIRYSLTVNVQYRRNPVSMQKTKELGFISLSEAARTPRTTLMTVKFVHCNGPVDNYQNKKWAGEINSLVFTSLFSARLWSDDDA